MPLLDHCLLVSTRVDALCLHNPLNKSYPLRVVIVLVYRESSVCLLFSECDLSHVLNVSKVTDVPPA